jgi:hypothetical protein
MNLSTVPPWAEITPTMPEFLISRLIEVLEHETCIDQVGINYQDAASLTSCVPAESESKRTPDSTRYVLTEAIHRGPAMINVFRFDAAVNGGLEVETAKARATLGEVLCISAL